MRRLVAVTAALGMVLLAMPAMAYPSPDTLLQAGYDPEAMVVYYTISDYEDGAEATEEGVETEEAEPTEVDVTGPEGQVNHGTVVSAVVASLLEQGYTGIGCLVRHFAQTDWGKETGVGEDGEELVEPSEEGLLLEVTTACKHGRPGAEDGEETEDEDGEEGSGRPAWAGPPGDNPDHPANQAGKGSGRP
ncbi:MAG: hypothetical protein R6X29_10220 [Acidimicrobiia bacterium]|jgi:hypothetical protein